jgi:DNA-binding NtrC family response regulator
LRERRDDLAELVERLVSRLGLATPPWMSRKEFLDQLALHPWPGNVRELRNYLERSLALGEPARLSAGAREPESPTHIDLAVPLRAARDAFERAYLELSLRHHEGNVSAAARSAGLDRLTFYRLLWRHGLR